MASRVSSSKTADVVASGRAASRDSSPGSAGSTSASSATGPVSDDPRGIAAGRLPSTVVTTSATLAMPLR